MGSQGRTFGAPRAANFNPTEWRFGAGPHADVSGHSDFNVATRRPMELAYKWPSRERIFAIKYLGYCHCRLNPYSITKTLHTMLMVYFLLVNYDGSLYCESEAAASVLLNKAEKLLHSCGTPHIVLRHSARSPENH